MSPASIYIRDGQRDLMQVMETLSEGNQVLYTTHSIFLANQNYPTRHRLLVRADRGTVLDSKPFLESLADRARCARSLFSGDRALCPKRPLGRG